MISDSEITKEALSSLSTVNSERRLMMRPASNASTSLIDESFDSVKSSTTTAGGGVSTVEQLR